MADDLSTEQFLEEVLRNHPDWCRTATVVSPEGDGTTLRLIYIKASSSVVCYNTVTQEKHFLPLDAELVKLASWDMAPPMSNQDREQRHIETKSETITTPLPPNTTRSFHEDA